MVRCVFKFMVKPHMPSVAQLQQRGINQPLTSALSMGVKHGCTCTPAGSHPPTLRHNPTACCVLVQGYARTPSGRMVDADGVERSSMGSRPDRTSVSSYRSGIGGQASGSPAPRNSSLPLPPGARDAARRAALTEGQGDRPSGGGPGGRRVSSGWDGGRVSADEYQKQVKDENRRAAAAAASSSLLTPPGSSGAPGAGARPQSGNKKFLQKYQLDKFNLFAP